MKNAEVYQMDHNDNNLGKIFFDYNDEQIDLSNYQKVADIEVEEDAINNIDILLEQIFQYGNTNPMYYNNNPRARSISVSDIIKFNDRYYYIQSLGFEDITDNIINKVDESKKLQEEENEEEIEDIEDTEVDEEEQTIYDLIVDREGVDLTIGEFNTILQSIFAKFNEIFLTTSEFYDMDPEENQTITIWDDEDEYTITFKIKDQIDPTIEIIDVEVL